MEEDKVEAMELTTLDQVENKLSNYYEIATSSGQETDAKKVLAKVLKCQLEVISVMRKPVLCRSAFNLFLETLNNAKRELSNGPEIEQMQQRIAIMINSMVFYLDACLHYQQDNSSAEGHDLLKKSCNLITENANNIMRATASNDVVAATALFENTVQALKGGLLEKILNYFSGKKKLKKLYDDHYSFLDSTIKKLDRNKHLFGKSSSILSELIHDKKDELVEYKYPMPQKPGAPDENIPWLFRIGAEPMYVTYIKYSLYVAAVPLVIIVIMFIILGAISLINLTPLNLDGAVSNMWTAIKYCGFAELACVALALAVAVVPWIAFFVKIIFCKIMRGRARKGYEKIASNFEW